VVEAAAGDGRVLLAGGVRFRRRIQVWAGSKQTMDAKEGSRRPLGPLGSPARDPPDGLLQRSLLGLLDPQRLDVRSLPDRLVTDPEGPRPHTAGRITSLSQPHPGAAVKRSGGVPNPL